MTRQIHHILMWGFIIFAMIHIYLVFYHDYIERRGVTSSMIGGWKFVEKKNLDKESRALLQTHMNRLALAGGLNKVWLEVILSEKFIAETGLDSLQKIADATHLIRLICKPEGSTAPPTARARPGSRRA